MGRSQGQDRYLGRLTDTLIRKRSEVQVLLGPPGQSPHRAIDQLSARANPARTRPATTSERPEHHFHGNDGSGDQPVGGNDLAKLRFVGDMAEEGDRCGDEAVGSDEVKTIGPQAGLGVCAEGVWAIDPGGPVGGMISPAP